MFYFFNSKIINSGYLPEYEGHQIYFEEWGNKNGEVILHFHGGPGGSISRYTHDYYNLRKYHVIAFDQRGSGKSLSEDIIALNDTKRLLKDAKYLLEYLNIKEKILVAGNSWGSTMALLFAERYPEIIKEIHVSSIFLARKQDDIWTLKQSALFYPDLIEEINHQSEGESPYRHYTKLIFSENLGDIQTAIKYMFCYDRELGSLTPSFKDVRIDNKIINQARIFLYYALNHFFLEDNEILNNILKIKDIPTFIIHNRLDMCCPLEGAWDLYRHLNNAKIQILPHIGHGGKELKKAVKASFK